MDKKIDELRKKIDELEKELARNSKEKRETKTLVVRSDFAPLEVLYKWKSPQRIFIKRDKAWFLKVTIIALLLILLAAFLQDFVVIVVIAVFVLLYFLLATIPPSEVEHEITSRGIRSMGTLYTYNHLHEFWVSERLGQKIVFVKTDMPVPSKLMLLVRRSDERTVVEKLGAFLDYRRFEKKQGWLSKATDGTYISGKRYADILPAKEGRKAKTGK